MRKILVLALSLTFLFTASICAADVSGTWVLKYSGSQGDERVLDMVIEASGENLTVATTHPDLGEMAGAGTLTGNDITITIEATGERKVGFELKGTVTGDKMSGTREVVRPARDDSEGERSGAERGARGDSEEGSSQRGARAESSDDAEAGAQGRGSGKASRSDSSQTEETSNAWTAEKK